MDEFIETIETTVKAHPLSADILRFLAEHEGAMDTLRGVARCWVDSDEVAVKSALDSLVAVGVVTNQSLSCGTYYSLTPDTNIRKWLRKRLPNLLRDLGTRSGGSTDRPGVGARDSA